MSLKARITEDMKTAMRSGEKDRLGERESIPIAALAFGADPNNRRVVDVQSAVADQIFVYDRIEVGIVNDVVDVAVDIVVHPTCRYRVEMPELPALRGWVLGHGY